MQNCSTKIFAAGFALLLLAGCKRDAIQTFRIAKDQAPVPIEASPTSALPPGHPSIGDATAPAPAMTPIENSTSPLTWKTPEGWTEVPPTELRLASFKINKDGKMADVSVIPLGAMAGTDEANVNRWRGQVGLSAVTSDELQKSAQNVEIGGQPAQLYDVVGTNPGSGDKTRILGAILHRADSTWFFKMTGDGDLAETQKPAFVEFLKSVKFSGATAQTQMPSTLPPGHPAIGDMAPATPAGPISHEGQPNWTVPSDWKEVSGGQFLVAKFLLGDGTTAVNVSMSAGDGGGLLPNVNRWRGQLGLQPVVDILGSEVDVSGGKGQLVELSGTNAQIGKPTKLIGVMVSQSNRTWFYKLMGDPTVVESQKDAFVKFVQSAKY
ncbi:MAG TPA: hypothetical protein VN516_04980 [Candidatus Baltobacteraceae bacterium]|nr:hypothetical protein [Candidatus Baltobacteraceae bacterium]